MREFNKKRGFLTFAQNGKTDYLRMAYALALSLKATQKDVSDLSVVITPGMNVPDKYREVFDQVIDVPWLDEAKESDWKLENEWKAYHVTPYEETVKLDADMLFMNDISEWWNTLSRQDVMFCQNVCDYRGEVATSDFYRKAFTSNELPNVYTAFMYFKYSDIAEDLFKMAETIFHNWERFFFLYMEEDRPKYVSTDVVFALAAKIIGDEDFVYPGQDVPSFVHMKTKLFDWPAGGYTENWTKHVGVSFTDDLELKIGRFSQHLPVHYHDKSFLTDEMIKKYEAKLGI